MRTNQSACPKEDHHMCKQRKILPSLLQRVTDVLLPQNFCIYGLVSSSLIHSVDKMLQFNVESLNWLNVLLFLVIVTLIGFSRRCWNWFG